MIIGIPKEVMSNEYRVALLPNGVEAFKSAGHQVIIEKSAGLGSGINDEDYAKHGARILESNKEIYSQSDMILKVKEPLPQEYDLLKRNQILLAFLHLAEEQSIDLTKALMDRKVVAIALEMVQRDDGIRPLVLPMSEIAGHMGVLIGAQHLQKTYDGKGIILGIYPGIPPAEVVILGGGNVGTAAAKTAVSLGARVTVLDLNIERLHHLNEIMQGKITTLISNPQNIEKSIKKADLLINAVYYGPYFKPKHLVARNMLKLMEPGSVILDISCNKLGALETCIPSDHPYKVGDIVHICIPNVPGAVPKTSTYALSQAVLPYALEIANKGWKRAIKENRALRRALIIVDGKIVNKQVADMQGSEYHPLEECTDFA